MIRLHSSHKFLISPTNRLGINYFEFTWQTRPYFAGVHQSLYRQVLSMRVSMWFVDCIAYYTK